MSKIAKVYIILLILLLSTAALSFVTDIISQQTAVEYCQKALMVWAILFVANLVIARVTESKGNQPETPPKKPR